MAGGGGGSADGAPARRPGGMIALDIETTGLDPGSDRILSIAVYPGEPDAAVFAGRPEAELIALLQAWLEGRPESTVVGWGSSHFDCPMLRRRADAAGAHLDLSIVGDPSLFLGRPALEGCEEAYRARFGRHAHLDAALRWRPWAKSRGLSCGLKAVSRAVGIDVVEVDRTRMEAMELDRLVAYNLSDARATYRLASMALPPWPVEYGEPAGVPVPLPAGVPVPLPAPMPAQA